MGKISEPFYHLVYVFQFSTKCYDLRLTMGLYTLIQNTCTDFLIIQSIELLSAMSHLGLHCLPESPFWG